MPWSGDSRFRLHPMQQQLKQKKSAGTFPQYAAAIRRGNYLGMLLMVIPALWSRRALERRKRDAIGRHLPIQRLFEQTINLKR